MKDIWKLAVRVPGGHAFPFGKHTLSPMLRHGHTSMTLEPARICDTISMPQAAAVRACRKQPR